MRLRDPRLGAPLPCRLALVAGVVLVSWPVFARAETETPPPSRLRNPLSGVARFLEPVARETNPRRPHFAGLPRREARSHPTRKASPQSVTVYAYSYRYVPYYYPTAPVGWPAYGYRRSVYYYSPIPGYAGY
jgi:hypothetical protein